MLEIKMDFSKSGSEQAFLFTMDSSKDEQNTELLCRIVNWQRYLPQANKRKLQNSKLMFKTSVTLSLVGRKSVILHPTTVSFEHRSSDRNSLHFIQNLVDRHLISRNFIPEELIKFQGRFVA